MTSSLALTLLLALILEATFGYPGWLLRKISHPVVWIGRLIQHCEHHWNKGDANRQFRMGLATLFLLLFIAGGTAWLLQALIAHFLPVWATIPVTALLATTGLAQRSLHDHAQAVIHPLLAGDLATARTKLSYIVGRDTAALEAEGIAAATTETVAESLCDGIVAPAFWFLLLGLPGLWMFKAVNTADSMIGHKDDRLRHFGKASALTDDGLNFVPARLAGLLLALSAGRRAKAAFVTMQRDGSRHNSPNAGWPEAAMAGALGVRLGGGAFYEGAWIDRPAQGDGPCPQPAQLPPMLRLYQRACLSLWLLCGGLAWLL